MKTSKTIEPSELKARLERKFLKKVVLEAEHKHSREVKQSLQQFRGLPTSYIPTSSGYDAL